MEENCSAEFIIFDVAPKQELGKYFELEAKRYLEQDWIKELDTIMFKGLTLRNLTAIHVNTETGEIKHVIEEISFKEWLEENNKNNFIGNESERL